MVDCDISASEFADETKSTNFVSTGQCMFGFLSGCVWGDDNSWKLRYVDLSQIPQKVLSITEKFGYWQLPNQPLKDSINMDAWEPDHNIVTISKTETINLISGERY